MDVVQGCGRRKPVGHGSPDLIKLRKRRHG
jgi:hypothetical protein